MSELRGDGSTLTAILTQGFELQAQERLERQRIQQWQMEEEPAANPAREKADSAATPNEEKELFEARSILISSPVNARLAHAVNIKLLAMERVDAKKPIYVFINSPGGEVHSGFSIFDTMRFIRPPIVTIVSGLAASMGSIISLAAKRERRFAFPNAKFMIHQPSIHGGLGGSVSDIEIHAKDLIDTKNRIIGIYAEECKQPEAEVRRALDRDTWMNPDAAKDFGLISKVLRSRADLPTDL